MIQPIGVPFTHFSSDKVRQVREQSPFADAAFAAIDRLYELACEARLYVVEGDTCAEDRNWRGMLVGASALVKLKSGRFVWPTGYNTKRTPRKNCRTKKCAERRLIERIKKINLDDPVDYVVAMMTVGDFQPDDETGEEKETLDLCGPCKRLCVRSKFTIPQTLVYKVQPPLEDGLPLYADMTTIKDIGERYVHKHHH